MPPRSEHKTAERNGGAKGVEEMLQLSRNGRAQGGLQPYVVPLFGRVLHVLWCQVEEL